MAYLGERKVGDQSPNHPWSNQTQNCTCIEFGRQRNTDLLEPSKGETRRITGDSCPVCVGSIVELVGHLPEYKGHKDLAIIRQVSGDQYLVPWGDLGPLVDPAAAEQRAKYANFSPYKGAVEYYDSLSEEDKELLRIQGIS